MLVVVRVRIRSRCSARKRLWLLLKCLPARSPLRAERQHHARPSREPGPRRGALGADAQGAVVVGGPVDGAQAAVRGGERVAGGP